MRKRPHPVSASEPPAAKAPTLGVGAAMPLPTMSTTRTVAALVAGGGEGAERLAAQIAPPASAMLLGRPTVLCKFFLRGSCQKGPGCTFSHDVQGMPTVPVDQKLKTPCRYFELGQCMRGPACKFAHGYEELAEISDRLKASKKGKVASGELGPDQATPESAAAAADATAALASASGFQSFDDFDPTAAGETDVQATVEAQTPLPPDIDDAWTSFLSQVSDHGDGEKGDQVKDKEVPEEKNPEESDLVGGNVKLDGQALRAELGWDKPQESGTPLETTSVPQDQAAEFFDFGTERFT